jgi:hypothetical protein
VTPVVAASAPLEHDPAELRERAEELLSRPPYAREPAGPIGEALRRLRDLFTDVLDTLFGAVGASPPLAWAVAVIGLVVLGLVVWRATRGLTGGGDAVVVPPGISARSAADWDADADEHARAGRLRDALRCRYNALVVTLLEGGVLEDLPGRTVRELDIELAASAPGLASDVEAAGRRLELAVYGDGEVTEDDVAVVDRAAEVVRSAVRPGRAVGAAS